MATSSHIQAAFEVEFLSELIPANFLQHSLIHCEEDHKIYHLVGTEFRLDYAGGGGGPHALTHVTGGGDTIANAVPSGNSGLMSGTDKTKLDGVASGAEVNVNADWNSSSGDSQILNKPATMPPSSHNNTAHSETYITQTAITTHEGAADPHTVYQKESEKGTASGYAGLDAGTKVPTTQLGGAGADSTKFLRGDQTWQAVSGGSPPTGILEDVQISILQSDGTLNAASGVQTWAGTNKTAQDVFTVTANTTYRVRGQWIVNTGATTHTTAIAWALSGATVASFQYLALLWSAAVNAITTTQSTVHVTGVASTVINATSTAVYTIIQFEGILVITNGGTITPQINFSANPTGTNLMKRGSWTSFTRLGADTLTVTGNWA